MEKESIIVKKETRNYSLDVLRIVATIFIVFHHYQQTFEVAFPTEINFFYGKFYFGYMVEFFFVLSGFFMATYIPKIQNGQSFTTFIKKRLVRLLPLIAIAALVYELITIWGARNGSAYVTSLSQSYGYQISVWGWIIDSLGIQAGGSLPNPFVNNPTWYVSVLICCYVIFYFITSIAKKINANPVWGYIGMILAGFSVDTYGLNLPFLNSTTSRGYIAFGGGHYIKPIL